MVGKVFEVRIAILATLHGLVIGVVVWSADLDADFEERVSVAACAIHNANSGLREVAKRTDFDAEESSGVSIEVVRADRVAADVEGVFTIGRTVQYAYLVDSLSKVVWRTLSYADQIYSISEVAWSRTGSQTLASRDVSIVFCGCDWTKQHTETVERGVVIGVEIRS